MRRALPGSRLRGRRRGLSLLTVLFALSLVALVAVVAIPSFFGRHEVTLDNACRLLSRDVRALQNRAALQKLAVRLVFDSDGWRALDSSGQGVAGLGEDQPIARRFSQDGVFEGVRVADIRCGPDSALPIDTRGLVGERGNLVLEFSGERRELEVERGSGQVLVGTQGGKITCEELPK